MKEWKKPFCKVVVLEEGDLVTSSPTQFTSQGETPDKGRGIKWNPQN